MVRVVGTVVVFLSSVHAGLTAQLVTVHRGPLLHLCSSLNCPQVVFFYIRSNAGPSKGREYRGSKLQWPTGGISWGPRRLVGPPSLTNKMGYFKKKTSTIFSLEGPRKNVSPGPVMALDGPDRAVTFTF